MGSFNFFPCLCACCMAVIYRRSVLLALIETERVAEQRETRSLTQLRVPFRAVILLEARIWASLVSQAALTCT